MPQLSRIAAAVTDVFTGSFVKETSSVAIEKAQSDGSAHSVIANARVNIPRAAMRLRQVEKGARRWLTELGKNAYSRLSDIETSAQSRLSDLRGNTHNLAPLMGSRSPSVSAPISPSDPRVRLIQNQCLKLSLSLLNRPQRGARSIGFTSALPGEGKSFMATITASALAERGHRPITLVDCNWDDPILHTRFDIPNSPGLAEWLRGECELADIRHSVSPYLTVIPSGDGAEDALALAERLRATGANALLTSSEESLIADLPSALTTDYGALLPRILDAALLVVRAGSTQETYIAEASRQLADAPLEGIVLNATRSSIPRWLLRML